jgi:hypothetical protein
MQGRANEVVKSVGEGAVGVVMGWGVGEGRQRQTHHFLPFGLPYFPKNVVPLHHDNNG